MSNEDEIQRPGHSTLIKALAAVGALVIALAVLGFVVGFFGAGSKNAPTSSAPATSGVLPATTPTIAYPNGEQGDKDFALQSIRVVTGFDGTTDGELRVTNVGDQSYDGTFTITFFASEDFTQAPIGTATASAIGVLPGQTATAGLISSDPAPTGHFYYQFQTTFEALA